MSRFIRAHIIIPWALVVALVWMILCGAIPNYFADPDEWFDVESASVSYVDDELTVCATSTINVPFTARWVTTVRRVDSNGVALFVASNEADKIYSYNVRERATFCEAWGPYTGLEIPATGLYRLEVVWPMTSDWNESRTQRSESRTFRIQ